MEGLSDAQMEDMISKMGCMDRETMHLARNLLNGFPLDEDVSRLLPFVLFSPLDSPFYSRFRNTSLIEDI